MKLITHNILTSKVLKNVVTGYPLKLNATKTEIKTTDYQPDFVNRMMKKVDYKALYEAAQTVNDLCLNILYYYIKLNNSFLENKAQLYRRSAASRLI